MGGINNSGTIVVGSTREGASSFLLDVETISRLRPDRPKWSLFGRARADRRRVLVRCGNQISDVTPKAARLLMS